MQTDRRFDSTNLSPAKQLLSSKYTAIAIILIASIGVYLNTLPNEFVYDDEYQVLGNHWIRDAKHIPEIFLSNVWAFVGKERLSNYYRPLMHITYMIDYHIFGLKPWGFHLTNIIFHAGVTLLVFLIASILINQSHVLNSKSQIPNPKSKIPKSKIQNPKSKIINLKSKIPNPKSNILNLKSEILTPPFMAALLQSAPFIAALLFAAHPIHTEAVTWIGGIPELSFTLFYLLSFYFYINSNKRYTPLNPLSRGENKNKRWGKRFTPHYHISAGFILSLIFFFLATLCKETALTLPLLLLVYDYSFRKDTLLPLSPKTLYYLLKRYLPYLIVSIIYFVLRTYALGGFAPEKKYTMLSSYELFINVFPLFIKYLEKLILPINMNAFYVFHPILSLFEWKGIITFILTLTFIFLVYVFRRHKVVFLSLLLIVIPLLPVLYIPVLGENTFADRYLYLPSIGFVILISIAIERIYQVKALRQSANFVIISVLTILIGLYSVGTIKRNYVWRDGYSLWTDTVEKSPDAYIPHNYLGNTYFEQQRFEDAIKEYMIAIKLKPDSPEAHNNIGTIYSKYGRFDEAIKEYMIAIKLRPNYPEAHNNIGNIYFGQQRFEDAIKEYMIAIKLKPNYPDLHYNLALTYSKQGRFEDAIKEYMTTLRLKPDYANAHYNLGNVYLAQGKFNEAIKEYLFTLELRPQDADIHSNLANAYSALGRFDEAIKEYMTTLRLKPDYAEAHYNLGLVYLEKGLKHKAEEEFKTALKLRPDFTPAKEALELVIPAN